MKNIGDVKTTVADKKKIEKFCNQLAGWVKKMWPTIQKYNGGNFVLDMTSLYLYIGEKNQKANKVDLDEKWKIACYRFIGRQRRLHNWDEMQKNGTAIPQLIYERELNLVQEAYEEMKSLCMQDSNYMKSWENKDIEDTGQEIK